ncbi:MAG: hypothetical protein ABR969_02015 [Sedimentisphaerales bacterium]|jgi:hypothetical protein
MNFKKLTLIDQSIIWINLDHVSHMQRIDKNNYSVVYVNSHNKGYIDMYVLETPEEILQTE